jgi:hypothetical protein
VERVRFAFGRESSSLVVDVSAETFVSYVAGGFVLAGKVCNWNITAEFSDGPGHWYQTFSGPGTGAAGDPVSSTARVRSTLKSNGGAEDGPCPRRGPRRAVTWSWL